MTTEPKFEYKYTDRDGATLDVHRYETSRGPVVSVNTKATDGRTGGVLVWLPPEEAPALAQAVLDAADARAFTDPEPKVEKVGGCYYVDGVHTACSELADTVKEAERRLAVVKFQQAEQVKSDQEKAAALQKRLDDLSLWFLGQRYDAATGGEKRAIGRIVELEDAK